MYYPKSQIKTNLYTNTGEYTLATTKESYTGYYYIVSNGSAFTGKTPEDGPNIRLIKEKTPPTSPYIISPIISTTILVEPNNGYPIPQPSERFLPSPTLTLPTDQDKSLGIFSRYFCKKNNEAYFIEISKKTFTLLKNNDPSIAWDLYSPIIMLWQIKGDKEKTYLANKNNAKLIEARQRWYGFVKYFKEDFLKYYLGS